MMTCLRFNGAKWTKQTNRLNQESYLDLIEKPIPNSTVITVITMTYVMLDVNPDSKT